MRKPDCILVRFGEISLKSKQVQKIWMNRFLSNVRYGLDSSKLDYKLSVNPSRLFIYTKSIEKVSSMLKRIFGITSFSYVWTCKSDIPDMKKLAVELAESIKLNNKKSFAIRARRSGTHAFTSQDMGRELGDAVNTKTGSKVNLTDPDKEIFAECRQDKAYLFLDKTDGPGGMPLGTAGKILSLLTDPTSAVAAWLMMKRGCWVTAVADKKNKDLVKMLEMWHMGKKINAYYDEDIFEVARKNRLRAISVSEKVKKKTLDKMYENKMLVLRPLVGLESPEIRRFLTQINSKAVVKR